MKKEREGVETERGKRPEILGRGVATNLGLDALVVECLEMGQEVYNIQTVVAKPRYRVL